jgi:hypothetical protein
LNLARFAPFFIRVLAISPLFAVSNPVGAAPVPTLSFDVTARVAATNRSAGPEQTVGAKVLLRGPAARVESSSGGTRTVVLFTPPYIYRLLPDSKAGVRWKIPARKASNYADFDPQQLLRDPTKIRAAMLRGGAKIIGKGVLGGMPVEIYQAKNFGGRGQNAKVWLRRSDSLPLRLESSGAQFKIVASWRNYARPKLGAGLFSAPTGYRVRTLAEAPPFSAL